MIGYRSYSKFTIGLLMIGLFACNSSQVLSDDPYEVKKYPSSISDQKVLKSIYEYCVQFNDGRDEDHFGECLRWNAAENWFFPGNGHTPECVERKTLDWDSTMLTKMQKDGATLDEIFSARAIAQSRIFIDCGGRRM